MLQSGFAKPWAVRTEGGEPSAGGGSGWGRAAEGSGNVVFCTVVGGGIRHLALWVFRERLRRAWPSADAVAVKPEGPGRSISGGPQTKPIPRVVQAFAFGSDRVALRS